MNMSTKDKASDKKPLGGGATPKGDRQPQQDDLAMDKDKREMEEELPITIEDNDDSLDQAKVPAKKEKVKAEWEIFQNMRGEEEELQGEKTKRKRGEDSPTTSVMTQKEPKKLREVGADEDKKTKLLESVMDLISRVDARVVNLYSTTSTSKNTKVEIKDEAERLVVLMKKLMNKDLGILLGDGESGKPQTREVGIQADLGGETDTTKDEEMTEVTSLEDIDTLEGWRAIATRRWNPEVFTWTGVVHGGDIMDTRDEVVKVVQRWRKGYEQ